MLHALRILKKWVKIFWRTQFFQTRLSLAWFPHCLNIYEPFLTLIIKLKQIISISFQNNWKREIQKAQKRKTYRDQNTQWQWIWILWLIWLWIFLIMVSPDHCIFEQHKQQTTLNDFLNCFWSGSDWFCLMWLCWWIKVLTAIDPLFFIFFEKAWK